MRQVRCALVSVFGIQQSPLRDAAAAGLSELIRLSTYCTHSRAQALPGADTLTLSTLAHIVFVWEVIN